MAAGMMATEAVAGAGSIAAGGIVASLQSVGAVGFTSGFAAGGFVSASVGAVALLGVGITRAVDSFVRCPPLAKFATPNFFPFRKIAIKANHNCKFLTVLGGGRGNWLFDMFWYTGVVKAEAHRINRWEEFTVRPYEGEGHYFALQAHHGALVCVKHGGCGHDANATGFNLGDWEKFQFFVLERPSEHLIKGYFRSFDGTYMTIHHSHCHFIANAREECHASVFEIHGRA
jgi:hypothetical protein